MSNPAEGSRTLVVEKVFSHSPEKLWRALTDHSLVAQWLLKNDFVAAVGQTFQFRADPVPHWDGVIDCKVLIVEPVKRLSYTWNSMGLESIVLFILTPAAGGTHLRMEQSGFRPDQEAAYKGAKHGWQNFLEKLDHLLKGDLA